MLRLALLSSVVLALGPAARTVPTPPEPPRFEAAPSDLRFSLTPLDDGRVQFGLSYVVERSGRPDGRGNTSHPQPWSAFEGLDPAVVAGPAGPLVAFRLDREAGDLDCSGAATGAGAGGTCRFVADAAFARALQARVGETPGEAELFHLALSGFSLDTLAELDRLGYARPGLDAVVAAGIHRVDAAYVRDMAAAGYRLGSLEDLTGFRIHNVTPQYVVAMRALGPAFQDLDADDIMALSIHRVTPDYVRDLAARGVAPGDPDALVGLRIHGVTPESVGALAAAGYADLSVDQHMAFAIHGVTPEFVRRMGEAGYSDLDADQLISLRIHGVTPDYARAMARQGVAERSTD